MIDTTYLPSGRCYPATMSARTVRDILYLKAMESANFIFEEKIVGIDPVKKIIRSDKATYPYDILIIASGGVSLKNSGSDGSIFNILKNIQPLSKITYGITNFKSTPRLSKKAKGSRVSARASLFIDNEKIKESVDDIIFQDYGLTGTAILDLSNEISLALLGKLDVRVDIDLLPTYNMDELVGRFKNISKNFPKRSIYEMLLGLINEKLIVDILKHIKLDKNTWIYKLDDKDYYNLAKSLKKLSFKIVDINDKDGAQVSIGGFDTRFIDETRMESKKYKDLYIIGEALDVSGSCGGYNIQWAFSSAKVAMEDIKENKCLR